jgi:hypothetical protein
MPAHGFSLEGLRVIGVERSDGLDIVSHGTRVSVVLLGGAPDDDWA